MGEMIHSNAPESFEEMVMLSFEKAWEAFDMDKNLGELWEENKNQLSAYCLVHDMAHRSSPFLRDPISEEARHDAIYRYIRSRIDRDEVMMLDLDGQCELVVDVDSHGCNRYIN